MSPTVIKGFVGLHGISSHCPEFVELSHHSANEMVLIQTLAGAYEQIGVKQNFSVIPTEKAMHNIHNDLVFLVKYTLSIAVCRCDSGLRFGPFPIVITD